MNRYPVLGQVLDPRYAGLPPDQLDAAFARLFGEGFSPEDAEGLFGSVGRAFNSAGRAIGQAAQVAAPVVSSALPGVLSGAMAGAALGPVGMLAGAALGGAGSALSARGTGPARTVGHVLSGAVNVAGAARGGGVGGLAAGGLNLLAGGGGGRGDLARTLGGALLQPGAGSGAAGQLLSLLGRPEVLQSLMALSLGPAGRRTVPGPGGTPIPTAAVAGLLRELADRAAQEADEGDETYLRTPAGEYVADPAVPEHRAALVLELLNEAEFARQARRAQAGRATRVAEDWEAEDWGAGPEADEFEDFGDLYADADEVDELGDLFLEDWR